MNKLVAMGELLIDFQAKGCGTLETTDEFVKKAGGAPANVCVQAAKLGVPAVYLTQVGCDAFGEFLTDTLAREGVDTAFIKKSPDYDTSLAFVSFGEGGERQFAFYRRTAADLYFTPADFDGVRFDGGDAFEFGSVALKTETSRAAHDSLIERARSSGALVCFDPNLRFGLWENRAALKSIVLGYAAKSDVIKVGDEELMFLTSDINVESAARAFLDASHAKLLCVTRGGRGACMYLADGRAFDFEGYRVKCVDTTGAGDSFFGGLIAELLRLNVTPENIFGDIDHASVLRFACRCGSYTTTGYGAMAAMGTRERINRIK